MTQGKALTEGKVRRNVHEPSSKQIKAGSKPPAPTLQDDIDFGDYVHIEMHRYGVPNEFFLHKVIGTFHSNTYVPVPVLHTAKEVRSDDGVVPVVACICCGIDETKVLKYRLSDVQKTDRRSF